MARNLDQRPVLLYPHPPGTTGHRLLQMLQRRVPNITKKEYLETFERLNLVTGPWQLQQARINMQALQSRLKGRTVVVLGNAARQVVGLEPLLIHPQIVNGVTWRQIPHPSPRNLWYEDETHRDLVALLLESLYLEWRGLNEGHSCS